MTLRNVTISMDEETARWARVEAAKREVSMSRFIGAILAERMRNGDAYEAAMRSYLSRKPTRMQGNPAPYPTRDELHDRAALR